MLEDMFFVEGCVFAIPRAAPRSIQASYRGQTSMLGVAVVEDEDVLMVVDKEEGKGEIETEKRDRSRDTAC